MGAQIILITVAVISLLLGVLVLAGSTQQWTLRLSFFTTSVCLGVWSLALGWFMVATSGSDLALAAKIFYMSAAIFPASLVVFMINVISRNMPYRHFLTRLVLLIDLLFVAYIAISPDFIISSMQATPYDIFNLSVNRAQYLAFAIFFIVFFVAAVLSGMKQYLRASGRQKIQLRIYLVGLIISSIPGFITNLWLPFFGNYSLVWVGPLVTIFFLGAVAYGIIRYDMFDIRQAASRMLLYILVLVTLAVIYVVLGYTISAFFLHETVALVPTSSHVVNFVLAMIMALLFQPIKHFFDQMTDTIFYQGQYNQETFLAECGQILAHDTDLRLLLKRLSAHIANYLKSETVTFYIAHQGIYDTPGTKKPKHIPRQDREKIYAFYRRQAAAGVMSAQEIKDAAMKKLFRLHSIALAVPLIHQEKELGLLIIGERKTGKHTPRDIRALESLMYELVIAVQNSLAVEEIRSLNMDLKQRVEEATRDLRASNQQLQQLDKAKNDFISMASHQLRTPLTSIKGYLDMLLQGDLGTVNATQKTVLAEAFSSSERMVQLINDFLNVSRLQTGKFIIDRHPANLATIAQEEVDMLRVLAAQKNIFLDVSLSDRVPTLSIDAEKIRQVVLNMIDNAIYYSRPDSAIHISLKKRGRTVEFTVKDTGIGVPKEEQAKLFGKFFRATNARKKRPDGTGVGLFLAKKVVVAHSGEIIFSSREGRGSTFGFRLPIK